MPLAISSRISTARSAGEGAAAPPAASAAMPSPVKSAALKAPQARR